MATPPRPDERQELLDAACRLLPDWQGAALLAAGQAPCAFPGPASFASVTLIADPDGAAAVRRVLQAARIRFQGLTGMTGLGVDVLFADAVPASGAPLRSASEDLFQIVRRCVPRELAPDFERELHVLADFRSAHFARIRLRVDAGGTWAAGISPREVRGWLARERRDPAAPAHRLLVAVRTQGRVFDPAALAHAYVSEFDAVALLDVDREAAHRLALAHRGAG